MYLETNKNNKKMALKTNISMRGTLAEMGIGEEVCIPLDLRRISSVRTAASILGLELGRNYKVALERETNNAKVTRLS